MKSYFEHIHKLLDFGNFDVLAHLDLPKRYFHMAGLELDVYEENLAEVNEVLLRLLEMDKGLEVNLSGLRTSLGKPMPDYNIIKMWNYMGGRKITIGSDAHTSNDVGKFVEDGLDLIAECGFNNITTYEKREAIFKPIEFKEYA
jgi:histidinol-phosphatase (PHP family)